LLEKKVTNSMRWSRDRK